MFEKREIFSQLISTLFCELNEEVPSGRRSRRGFVDP
jgi:hypothetical protein